MRIATFPTFWSWALAFLVVSSAHAVAFDPLSVAASHPIVMERPGATFFDGALLGNGGLGAVVCTRPDAIMIHFGHNDVWDQRIAVRDVESLGIFDEVFDKLRAISPELESLSDDPWYESYRVRSRENYREKYPRPFPCGTLVLGFDSRRVEMLGRSVDIATGVCHIQLSLEGKPITAEVFVEMGPDRLWLRVLDAHGAPVGGVFDRIHLFEDPETPEELPRRVALEPLPENALGFRQTLPYRPPHVENAHDPHPNDRAFRIAVRTSASLDDATWTTSEGGRRAAHSFERALREDAPFYAVVAVEHGKDTALPLAMLDVSDADEHGFATAQARTEAAWAEYWRKSGVRISSEDRDAAYLERVWYWNHYFFNCATRPESVWPGLYANWSYRDVGTMWHGDYHLDYNVQQPTWLTFSSNRVDKHLAYVRVLHEYWLPVARDWAARFYGMRGAFFPVTLYPIEMQINPYPVPPWGYMISCTPWAVQSLWWHYEYTLDTEFLRDRAFGPMREAVEFLVDYMTRPDARDKGTYHVFPSAVPELYGFVPGLRYSKNPLADLALIKFLFHAYLEAVEVLAMRGEAETVAQVREILAHFPEYATADSEYGPVFINVDGEDPDIVQNVPASMMNVYPGEDYSLDVPADVREILLNTWRNLRTEGGNDLVFRNMIGARLGQLDLAAFARELRYAEMRNGVLSNRVLQVHGRYHDSTDFHFMDTMGFWFENFAAPAVINECLMQSWDNSIRLFPNWPREWNATFTTLRAKGAFLVSAEQRDGTVRWIEIHSERGAPLRLRNPWPEGTVVVSGSTSLAVGDRWIEGPTTPGETLRFEATADR